MLIDRPVRNLIFVLAAVLASVAVAATPSMSLSDASPDVGSSVSVTCRSLDGNGFFVTGERVGTKYRVLSLENGASSTGYATHTWNTPGDYVVFCADGTYTAQAGTRFTVSAPRMVTVGGGTSVPDAQIIEDSFTRIIDRCKSYGRSSSESTFYRGLATLYNRVELEVQSAAACMKDSSNYPSSCNAYVSYSETSEAWRLIGEEAEDRYGSALGVNSDLKGNSIDTSFGRGEAAEEFCLAQIIAKSGISVSGDSDTCSGSSVYCGCADTPSCMTTSACADACGIESGEDTGQFDVDVTILDSTTLEIVDVDSLWVSIRVGSCDGESRGYAFIDNGRGTVTAEYYSGDGSYYACFSGHSGYDSDSNRLLSPSPGDRITTTLRI